jgi:cysteine protease ATG4
LRRIEIREMDPSMLIAFLVRDEADFNNWKENVVAVQGKSIVHISASKPPPRGVEREGAVDEVESFDEQEEVEEGEGEGIS